jgi:bacterioferritin-associated ferredoxin
MIVCHCNVITARHIEDAVADLLAEDPHRLLTPGLVYMTLGKRGRCCGCFPNAIEVIRRAAEVRGATLAEPLPAARSAA